MFACTRVHNAEKAISGPRTVLMRTSSRSHPSMRALGNPGVPRCTHRNRGNHVSFLTLTVSPPSAVHRRYAYEPERSELAAGDRVRVTRNDAARHLANGDRFVVADVTRETVTLRWKTRGRAPRRQAAPPRPRLSHDRPRQPGNDRRARPHRRDDEKQDDVAGGVLRRDQPGAVGGAHLYRRHRTPPRRSHA